MKNTLERFFLHYSTIAVLFLIISGFASIKNIESASFQLMLLPVALYLLGAEAETVISQSKNVPSDPKLPGPAKKRGPILLVIVLFVLVFSIGMLNILKKNVQQDVGESYSTPSTPIIFQKKESVKKYIVAKNGNQILEIKKEANLKSETLMKAEPTAKFELIEQIEGWYKVKIDDTNSGYVSTVSGIIFQE